MDDQPSNERTGNVDEVGDEPVGETERPRRFVHEGPWKYMLAVFVLLILWFGFGQLCPPTYWRF